MQQGEVEDLLAAALNLQVDEAYLDVHYRSRNPDLIELPKAVLDYVVAHEVCHLLHRNHSPEFWRTVARLMPDWRERGDWLAHYESDWDL